MFNQEKRLILRKNKQILLRIKTRYDKENFSFDEVKTLADEHIKLINEKLVSYKQIRTIELTNVEMEKTTTGKIKRH